MFKTRFFSILALLLMATGAWAETTWEVLSVGSTTGMTLGESGTTKYYYPTTDLEFSNTNVGGSGLTIRGTVYLYIPEGVTITATGANASGATGAGAGIELAEGNVLYIIGKGKVIATGGNAANGGNGGNGGDAILEYDEKCQPGSGGNGGNGGGGAGAGIGTRGGNGGNGGTGATAIRTRDEGKNLGVDGNAGSVGNAAGNMGELYVDQTGVTVTATGGSAATSGGAGGNRGKNAAEDPYNQNTASGGGGGGGGGFGGAASNIGTGGPGGGGGGGGAAGNSAMADYGFYQVGAGGGKGGHNADGSYASDGVTSELTSMHDAELKAGFDSDDSYTDQGWESDNGMHYGGNGGGKGSDSSSGSTNPTTTTNIPPAYAPVTKYNLTLADGTEDATNWTITPAEATTTGVAAGTEVKATYSGMKKVKSVKAKKKAKPAATVTTAPTAKTGVKAGEDVAIVNEGAAEGGTMMYMVNATQPASTDGFSATVPTAKTLAAGTYYVWYYVKADDSHTDSEISASGIEVTIAAAETTVTWTTTEMNAEFLVYDGWANNNSHYGITVTASGSTSWETDNIHVDGPTTFTFTSTVGNIKSIVITAENINIDEFSAPSGWTRSEPWEEPRTLSWNGTASTTVNLPLSEEQNFSGISTIVFTVVE